MTMREIQPKTRFTNYRSWRSNNRTIRIFLSSVRLVGEITVCMAKGEMCVCTKSLTQTELVKSRGLSLVAIWKWAVKRWAVSWASISFWSSFSYVKNSFTFIGRGTELNHLKIMQLHKLYTENYELVKLHN